MIQPAMFPGVCATLDRDSDPRGTRSQPSRVTRHLIGDAASVPARPSPFQKDNPIRDPAPRIHRPSSAASAGESWFSQTRGAGFTVAHTGGVIGPSPLPTRQADTAWLKTAARYHTGGIAGLKPNEVPAILEGGEEVLTKADARHRNNGGGAAGSSMTVKNVDLFDTESAAQELLNTRAGEEAFLNIISRNPRAAKAALGG